MSWPKTLRNSSGITNVGSGARGALQEKRKSLKLRTRDRLAAVHATITREQRRHASQGINDDKRGNGNGISRRSQVMMRQAQHNKKEMPNCCSMDP